MLNMESVSSLECSICVLVHNRVERTSVILTINRSIWSDASFESYISV